MELQEGGRKEGGAGGARFSWREQRQRHWHLPLSSNKGGHKRVQETPQPLRVFLASQAAADEALRRSHMLKNSTFERGFIRRDLAKEDKEVDKSARQATNCSRKTTSLTSSVSSLTEAKLVDCTSSRRRQRSATQTPLLSYQQRLHHLDQPKQQRR